jgi:hypothetical protein
MLQQAHAGGAVTECSRQREMNRAIKDSLHDTQGAVVNKLRGNMCFRNISIQGVPKMPIQAGGGRKTDATKKFNCLLQPAANHACVLIA